MPDYIVYVPEVWYQAYKITSPDKETAKKYAIGLGMPVEDDFSFDHIPDDVEVFVELDEGE